MKEREIYDEKLAEYGSSDGDEKEFVCGEADGKYRLGLRSRRQRVEHIEEHETSERHRCVPVKWIQVGGEGAEKGQRRRLNKLCLANTNTNTHKYKIHNHITI